MRAFHIQPRFATVARLAVFSAAFGLCIGAWRLHAATETTTDVQAMREVREALTLWRSPEAKTAFTASHAESALAGARERWVAKSPNGRLSASQMRLLISPEPFVGATARTEIRQISSSDIGQIVMSGLEVDFGPGAGSQRGNLFRNRSFAAGLPGIVLLNDSTETPSREAALLLGIGLAHAGFAVWVPDLESESGAQPRRPSPAASAARAAASLVAAAQARRDRIALVSVTHGTPDAWLAMLSESDTSRSVSVVLAPQSPPPAGVAAPNGTFQTRDDFALVPLLDDDRKAFVFAKPGVQADWVVEPKGNPIRTQTEIPTFRALTQPTALSFAEAKVAAEFLMADWTVGADFPVEESLVKEVQQASALLEEWRLNFGAPKGIVIEDTVTTPTVPMLESPLAVRPLLSSAPQPAGAEPLFPFGAGEAAERRYEKYRIPVAGGEALPAVLFRPDGAADAAFVVVEAAGAAEASMEWAFYKDLLSGGAALLFVDPVGSGELSPESRMQLARLSGWMPVSNLAAQELAIAIARLGEILRLEPSRIGVFAKEAACWPALQLPANAAPKLLRLGALPKLGAGSEHPYAVQLASRLDTKAFAQALDDARRVTYAPDAQWSPQWLAQPLAAARRFGLGTARGASESNSPARILAALAPKPDRIEVINAHEAPVAVVAPLADWPGPAYATAMSGDGSAQAVFEPYESPEKNPSSGGMTYAVLKAPAKGKAAATIQYGGAQEGAVAWKGANLLLSDDALELRIAEGKSIKLAINFRASAGVQGERPLPPIAWHWAPLHKSDAWIRASAEADTTDLHLEWHTTLLHTGELDWWLRTTPRGGGEASLNRLLALQLDTAEPLDAEKFVVRTNGAFYDSLPQRSQAAELGIGQGAEWALAPMGATPLLLMNMPLKNRLKDGSWQIVPLRKWFFSGEKTLGVEWPILLGGGGEAGRIETLMRGRIAFPPDLDPRSADIVYRGFGGARNYFREGERITVEVGVSKPWAGVRYAPGKIYAETLQLQKDFTGKTEAPGKAQLEQWARRDVRILAAAGARRMYLDPSGAGGSVLIAAVLDEAKDLGIDVSLVVPDGVALGELVPSLNAFRDVAIETHAGAESTTQTTRAAIALANAAAEFTRVEPLQGDYPHAFASEGWSRSAFSVQLASDLDRAMLRERVWMAAQQTTEMGLPFPDVFLKLPPVWSARADENLDSLARTVISARQNRGLIFNAIDLLGDAQGAGAEGGLLGMSRSDRESIRQFQDSEAWLAEQNQDAGVRFIAEDLRMAAGEVVQYQFGVRNESKAPVKVSGLRLLSPHDAQVRLIAPSGGTLGPGELMAGTAEIRMRPETKPGVYHFFPAIETEEAGGSRTGVGWLRLRHATEKAFTFDNAAQEAAKEILIPEKSLPLYRFDPSGSIRIVFGAEAPVAQKRLAEALREWIVAASGFDDVRLAAAGKEPEALLAQDADLILIGTAATNPALAAAAQAAQLPASAVEGPALLALLTHAAQPTRGVMIIGGSDATDTQPSNLEKAVRAFNTFYALQPALWPEGSPDEALPSNVFIPTSTPAPAPTATPAAASMPTATPVAAPSPSPTATPAPNASDGPKIIETPRPASPVRPGVTPRGLLEQFRFSPEDMMRLQRTEGDAAADTSGTAATPAPTAAPAELSAPAPSPTSTPAATPTPAS